eukprot:CAMPEP_0194511980 /NCGR_PEP_ID=MMETSP0253-20130528/43814_1 /TAXON_ID=2966 /ORGANISM="Noctiluca scintillans" /LENGTH=393 /DNA_ID=CAMNT_0039355377 /DNA_START=1 /DNA_END=1182 /DNA_ORIENTATION=-
MAHGCADMFGVEHEFSALVDFWTDFQEACTPTFRSYEADDRKKKPKRRKLDDKTLQKSIKPASSCVRFESRHVPTLSASCKPKKSSTEKGNVATATHLDAIGKAVRVCARPLGTFAKSVSQKVKTLVSSGNLAIQSVMEVEVAAIMEFGSDVYDGVTPATYEQRRTEAQRMNMQRKLRKQKARTKHIDLIRDVQGATLFMDQSPHKTLTQHVNGTQNVVEEANLVLERFSQTPTKQLKVTQNVVAEADLVLEPSPHQTPTRHIDVILDALEEADLVEKPTTKQVNGTQNVVEEELLVRELSPQLDMMQDFLEEPSLVPEPLSDVESEPNFVIEADAFLEHIFAEWQVDAKGLPLRTFSDIRSSRSTWGASNNGGPRRSPRMLPMDACKGRQRA